MQLLSAILFREGIDPKRAVSWKVYDAAALESALAAKAVSCVAASDPLGYELLSDLKAEPFLNPAGGGFSCGTNIAADHHCFLAVAGRLVRRRPSVAAALTRAYVAASAAILPDVGPPALAEKGAVVGGFDQTIAMLSSYDWNASPDLVIEELQLTARDFRRAGLIERSTDPAELAARAFADVLRV